MREVAIIGVGMTKFGELWGQGIRDVFAEAALKAIEEAGVAQIDSLYVGCMSSGLYAYQEHLGSVMADYIGQKGIPAARVESACASGSTSIRAAFMEVASGMSDIVLAGGVEKNVGCRRRNIRSCCSIRPGVRSIQWSYIPGIICNDGSCLHGKI